MQNPIKLIKIILASLIVISVLSYTYYQTKDYLKGPILELDSPKNNSTHHQNSVAIEGHAKNISFISMNGRQIFTDQSGRFSEEVILSKGINIIDIFAKDKFERENEKILNLVYLVK
ncbi:MAG: hypothetical protein U9P50_01380 [Patescibacteria group bacterium]|nr:hypothetical protein [Patescibacteria group bacterium]